MPLVVGVRVGVGVGKAVGIPGVRKGHRQRQRVEAGVRSVRLIPRISVAGMGHKRGSEWARDGRGGEVEGTEEPEYPHMRSRTHSQAQNTRGQKRVRTILK